jgi:uncharacterized lipoprotein
MKKTILIVGIIAAIAGCGSNETKQQRREIPPRVQKASLLIFHRTPTIKRVGAHR